ncbi:MAG: hypothetical protein ACI9YP_001303, partial [Colwellia sp.]
FFKIKQELSVLVFILKRLRFPRILNAQFVD